MDLNKLKQLLRGPRVDLAFQPSALIIFIFIILSSNSFSNDEIAIAIPEDEIQKAFSEGQINDDDTISYHLDLSTLILINRIGAGIDLKSANPHFSYGLNVGYWTLIGFDESLNLPDVGIHSKWEFTPENSSTIYLKGRAYRMFNTGTGDQNLIGLDLGYKLNGPGLYIEFSANIPIDADADFIIPMLRIGAEFGR